MKESDETEEIRTFPLYPYLQQGQQALPNITWVPPWCKIHDSFALPNHPQGTHWAHLNHMLWYSLEVPYQGLLMSTGTHKICFHGEIRNIMVLYI